MFSRDAGKSFILFLAAGILLTGVYRANAAEIATDAERQSVPRVSPQYAHQELVSGRALLVCAYPDVEVCEKVMIRGAIPLKDLEARLPQIRKDQEIIFYCA